MIHGGDIYSFYNETGMKPLDFSENTNPLSLPLNVKKAIIDSVDKFNVYPDLNCHELSFAVSKYYDIPKEFLLFGNGAADIIFKVAYAIKPKNALILAPTFAEYEISLKNIGTKVDYFSLKEENNFNVTEEILSQIPSHDIVYICNPNNPTGQVCSRDLMLKIALECKKNNAFLVIDECFMDFVEDYQKSSFKDEIKNFDNVIMLKAFTKIFAMAGLRLGFCVSSNADLLEKINSFGQPWSVSTVAQVAGVACCSEYEYVKESLKLIKNEREYLQNSLKNLSIQTFESKANYILFKYDVDLVPLMKEKGIMIRSCANYNSLNKKYYRIAVKNHSENLRLINAITEISKLGD